MTAVKFILDNLHVLLEELVEVVIKSVCERDGIRHTQCVHVGETVIPFLAIYCLQPDHLTDCLNYVRPLLVESIRVLRK